MGKVADLTDIDHHIARAIRRRRLDLGLRLRDVGERAGISLSQIDKYESGDNRIMAARLWLIAEALETPVADLYPPKARYDG